MDIFSQGLKLFGQRRMREALKMAELLTNIEDSSGYMLTGFIFEYGGDGVIIDLNKALASYEVAIRKGGFAAAQLGAVRVLIRLGGRQNIAKATDYCEKLLIVSNRAIDYLTLGKIYEKHAQPIDLQKAQRLYLKAGLKGLIAGLRDFARLEYNKSKFLGGVCFVILAIVWPIMGLLLGKKAHRLE